MENLHRLCESTLIQIVLDPSQINFSILFGEEQLYKKNLYVGQVCNVFVEKLVQIKHSVFMNRFSFSKTTYWKNDANESQRYSLNLYALWQILSRVKTVNHTLEEVGITIHCMNKLCRTRGCLET